MDNFIEFYDKIDDPIAVAHMKEVSDWVSVFSWDRPVNYELLSKMIEYNIVDKKDWTLFWRK